MIELRPSRDLLDPNFGGYKLSLDPVPIFRQGLECEVDHVLPSDDQFSFLHVRVFSLHNHLYTDPWSQDDVYYIDTKWRVQKSAANPNTGRLEDVKEVWEMPSHRVREPGHYNTSMSFPSQDLAVMSDGAGTLHIAQTGDRTRDTMWQLQYSDEVCGKEKAFVILNSRCCVVDDKTELHCVVLHIEEAARGEDGERPSSGAFVSTLEWITLLEGETGNWSMRCVRQLSGPGAVNYIALEPGCKALYVGSDNPFGFTMDSENPCEPNVESELEKRKDEKKEVKSAYMWQQSEDDLSLTFRLPDGAVNKEVEVILEDLTLRISYAGKTLLEGQLFSRVENSFSNWTVGKGMLHVYLSKVENGLTWNTVVQGDDRGEEVLNPALVDEVHRRLAHLCSDQEEKERGCTPGFNSEQLEECDALPNTMAVLRRLDPVTHASTQQVNLGGLLWLFNTHRDAEEVPAFCMRHDVDGCVWQPGTPGEKSDEWPFTHVGTFMAFGYVQASKQQRKFSVGSPDMSYVAICEASRHIYIYRQSRPTLGELRNRRTGQVVSHTAKQQLVNLDTTSELLGVHASSSTLYVLTSDTLLALQINPSLE